MSSDVKEVEELPAIDMAAVIEERKAIAAAAYPNDGGNYVPRAVKEQEREQRRQRAEQRKTAQRAYGAQMAFLAAIAAAGQRWKQKMSKVQGLMTKGARGGLLS